MKKCKCGYSNEDSKLYCVACGKSLDKNIPSYEIKTSKNNYQKETHNNDMGQKKIDILNLFSWIYLILGIICTIIIWKNYQSGIIFLAMLLNLIMFFTLLQVICKIGENIIKILKKQK